MLNHILYMPYKDKVRNREYQREWAKRKREGLDTKIVNSPSKKLSEEEKKQRQREYNKKYADKRRNIMQKLRGGSCLFCGESEKRLSSHNIHGDEHDKLTSMGLDNIKEILSSGDFVALCYKCHKHIHFCTEVLNMSWDDIMNFYNRKA